MLEINYLAAGYGRIDVLRDVSVAVPNGAIVGLLGPNGAGKSTTLRMLYGVLRPDRGRALIDGIDVARAPRAWAPCRTRPAFTRS